MFDNGVPRGTKPTMVAWRMTVVSVRRKSSAVSVSILPALGRRDSAPSLASVFPVLKKKLSAHAGVASDNPIVNVAIIKLSRILIAIGFIQDRLVNDSGRGSAIVAADFPIPGLSNR